MTVSGTHLSAPSYDNVCGTLKPLTQQESDEMDRVGAPSHVLLLNLRGGSSTVAERPTVRSEQMIVRRG